jgi:hypothetical protein
MKHFFAPVPAVHIVSAWETFQKEGKVAFGSNQYELLLSLNGQAATIWIGASAGYVPSGGVSGVDIGKVLYKARFVEAEFADRRGNPQKPNLRPVSTAGDSAWTIFYVVNEMKHLAKPIPSAALKRKGGGGIDTSPHMLTAIEPP